MIRCWKPLNVKGKDRFIVHIKWELWICELCAICFKLQLFVSQLEFALDLVSTAYMNSWCSGRKKIRYFGKDQMYLAWTLNHFAPHYSLWAQTHTHKMNRFEWIITIHLFLFYFLWFCRFMCSQFTVSAFQIRCTNANKKSWKICSHC